MPDQITVTRTVDAKPGTEVTQTYDWSRVDDEGSRGFFPFVTEDQMAQTIDNVAEAAS